MSEKPNCLGCRYSAMDMDMDPYCAHKDAGEWGVILRRATSVDGHCGPDRPKYVQHPDRKPDGTRVVRCVVCKTEPVCAAGVYCHRCYPENL